jgi:serine/threonine-protein kinase HipA
MAMALKGKTPHYTWERIKYRHWLNTARLCGFPVGYIEGVITEVLDTMDQTIELVGAQVSEGPAVRVAESIFNGMRIAREMLVKYRTEEGG